MPGRSGANRDSCAPSALTRPSAEPVGQWALTLVTPVAGVYCSNVTSWSVASEHCGVRTAKTEASNHAVLMQPVPSIAGYVCPVHASGAGVAGAAGRARQARASQPRVGRTRAMVRAITAAIPRAAYE